MTKNTRAKMCWVLLAVCMLILCSDAALAKRVVQKPRATPLRLANKLVFTRSDAQGVETVWSMQPDGSGQRRIWQVPRGYGRFSGFSRDGTQAISFNQFNLYIYDLRFGRRRTLLLWNSGWGTFIESPSFSSDGRWVVCAAGYRPTDEDSHILRLDVRRSYSIKRGYSSVMSAAVKGPLYPSSIPMDFRQPRLSVSGRQLAATGGNLNFLDDRGGHQLEIWLLNIDGKNPRRLTDNDVWDEMPCLSADGKRVAFIRHGSPQTKHSVYDWSAADVFVMNADGSEQKSLTTNIEASIAACAANPNQEPYSSKAQNPLFSRDGQKIGFSQESADEKKSGIFIINADGTGSKRLSDGKLVQWVW